MSDVARDFELRWSSLGHAEVQAEADQVDEALGAVADGIAEVTRRSEPGRRSLGAYGASLDESRRDAERAEAALDELASSAGNVERELKRVDSGSRVAGGGLGDINDAVRENLQGFDEMQGRLGQVTNAINLLSGVAIFGAVESFKTGVTAIYEWTEAGKKSKEGTEAHNAALQGTIAKLTSISDLTRVATGDMVSFYRAQRELKRVETELSPLLEKRIELQEKLEYRQRQLQLAMVDGNAHIRTVGLRGLIYYGEQIADVDDKIAALTATHRSNKSALAEVTSTMEQGGDVFGKVSGWYEAAVASQTKATTAQSDALARLRRELELVEAIDLGNLPSVTLDDIIPAESFDPDELLSDLIPAVRDAVAHVPKSMEELGADMAAALHESREEFEAFIDKVEQLDALEWAGLENAGQILRGLATEASSAVAVFAQMAALESGNAVQRAKNRQRDAKGDKERLAAAKALYQAEKAAEAERRKFQAAEFALKAAENAGAAIEETAKAAGSYPDPVGIALHGFAAVKHAAAAVFYGRGVSTVLSAPSAVAPPSAGGGAAGGSIARAPSRSDQPSGGASGGSSTTNIYLGTAPMDERSVRTAVVDAYNVVGDGQPTFEAA